MDPKWKGVILEVIHTLDSETLVFLQDMISGELDIRGERGIAALTQHTTHTVPRITDKDITFSISEEDFERAMVRPPLNQQEFNKFVSLTRKALKDTEHIDWDIIYSCVREEM